MAGSVVIKQSDSSEEDTEKNFTSQFHVLIAWKITKWEFFPSVIFQFVKSIKQNMSEWKPLDEELY